MKYKCPVCSKITNSSLDLVRHMMGRGDKEHRDWIMTKGFNYSTMLMEQAQSFGGMEYKRFAQVLEAETILEG